MFNQSSVNPLLLTLFVLFFLTHSAFLQPLLSPPSFPSQPNLSISNQPVPNPCLNNLQPFFFFSSGTTANHFFSNHLTMFSCLQTPPSPPVSLDQMCCLPTSHLGGELCRGSVVPSIVFMIFITYCIYTVGCSDFFTFKMRLIQ